MFELFAAGATTHRAGSTSNDMSSRDTCSPSSSARISSSDLKPRAQLNDKGPALRGRDLKPQPENISSSYFYNNFDSPDVSTHETLFLDDLTIDPEFENELVVDPLENNLKSATGLPSSLSTLQLCRRLQRQLNSQFFCTHSQVKAISELMEEMVTTQSQCNVLTPALGSQPLSGTSSGPVSDELEVDDNAIPENLDDEGYCEGGMDDDEANDVETIRMNLHRAYMPLGIRREYANGVVFAKPRTRRKILRRKRPEDRVENRVQTGM